MGPDAHGQRQQAAKMARKIKPRAPPKAKRNPMARSLSGGKYRLRVVPRIASYKRRPKHAKPLASDAE
jgi:hypothetical protein